MISSVSPCPRAIKLKYFHHFPRAAQPWSALQSYAVTTCRAMQHHRTLQSVSPAAQQSVREQDRHCRAVPRLPQLWEQAKMFIKILAWAGNLNPALSEHYLMASVGTEDTQSSLEPLTSAKVKFSIFQMCFEEEIWKCFRRLFCSQQKTLKSVCLNQSVSLQQVVKRFHRSKQQGNRKISQPQLANSLSFSHVKRRIFVLKFIQIYFSTQSPASHKK